jgi:DNA adenine methylase
VSLHHSKLDIIVISDDDYEMRYPGGKGKCYQHLINLMPPHQTYIESHLGGGAVLRNKKPAERNIGIDIDPKVISRWQAEYSGVCELLQTDAINFFSKYNFQGNELIYVDPPYLPETRRQQQVYTFDYNRNDHERLLDVLIKLPCMVMLSGYDNELYNAKLHSWRKIKFSAKTHVDVREECVWLNFEPSNELHDMRHYGATFRERQTIKRRQERLHNRIQSMSSHERGELIQWLKETYSAEQGVA